MRDQVIVGGHYLDALTNWGDLDYSLCWPGYSDEMTFDVAALPSAARIGALVTLVRGGERRWSGLLEEPARGEKLRASGLHRAGVEFSALDGTGELTLSPDTALAAAIARGLPWIKDIPWPTGDVPLNADTLANVSQIIDADTDMFPGFDWGILPSGAINRRPRPTPRLHLRPGGDGLTIARDNYASTLIARYYDTTTDTYQTAIRTDPVAAARWGYKEVTLKKALNDAAPMTEAQAEAILDSMLAAGRARPGWTQVIELDPGTLVNNHQQPVDPATVQPWEQVRLHGLVEDVAELSGRSWVDMAIGRLDFPATGNPVLTPAGLVNPMTDLLEGNEAA